MAVMLEEASEMRQVDPKLQSRITLEYLDVTKKFDGMIRAQSVEGVLVDSAAMQMQEAQRQAKIQKQVLEILGQNPQDIDILVPRTLERMFKESAHFQHLSEKAKQDLAANPEKYQKYQALDPVSYDKQADERLASFYEASRLTDYFINDQQQQDWLKFCLECTKTPKGTSDLNKLMQQVVGNNLQSQWANIMFTQVYNEEMRGLQAPPPEGEKAQRSDPATQMQAVMGRLSENFDQLEERQAGQTMSPLERIKEAKKIIATIKAQIPMWAEASNFEKLYTGPEGFSEQVKQARKLLEFNPNASLLEQMMLIEARDKLIDTVDLTAKSLQNSGLYQDKDQHAKNFTQLITVDFYELMKQCVTDGGYPDGEKLFRNLATFIKEDGHNSNTAKADQLNLAQNIDISSITIGTAGLFDLTENHGFNRGFSTKNPTVASLHTLLHQNAIVANTKLSNENNKLLFHQLPELIQNLDIALKNAKNSDENRDSILPNKSTIYNLHDQILEIEYNIPLRNHSCKAYITYDLAKNKIYLKYNIFGNARLRWQQAADYNESSLKILEILDGLNITQPVYFSNEKGVVSFEVEIEKTDQIPQMLEIINNNIAISFSNRVISTLLDNKIASDRVIETIEILLQKLDPKNALDFFSYHTRNCQHILIQKLFEFQNDESSKKALITTLLNSGKFIYSLTDDNKRDFFKQLFTLAEKKEFNSDVVKVLENLLSYNSGIIMELFALKNYNTELQKTLAEFLSNPEQLLATLNKFAQSVFIKNMFALKDSSSPELQKAFAEFLSNPEQLLGKLDASAAPVFIENMFALKDSSNPELQKSFAEFLSNSEQLLGTLDASTALVFVENMFVLKDSSNPELQKALAEFLSNSEQLLKKLDASTALDFVENMFALKDSSNPELQKALAKFSFNPDLFAQSLIDTLNDRELLSVSFGNQETFLKKLFALKNSGNKELQQIFISTLSNTEKFLEHLYRSNHKIFISELFSLKDSNNPEVKNIFIDFLTNPEKLMTKLSPEDLEVFINDLFSLKDSKNPEVQQIFKQALLTNPEKFLQHLFPSHQEIFFRELFSLKDSNNPEVQQIFEQAVLTNPEKFLQNLSYSSHKIFINELFNLKDSKNPEIQRILIDSLGNSGQLLEKMAPENQKYFIKQLFELKGTKELQQGLVNALVNSGQLLEKLAPENQEFFIKQLFELKILFEQDPQDRSLKEAFIKVLANSEKLLTNLPQKNHDLFIENLFSLVQTVDNTKFSQEFIEIFKNPERLISSKKNNEQFLFGLMILGGSENENLRKICIDTLVKSDQFLKKLHPSDYEMFGELLVMPELKASHKEEFLQIIANYEQWPISESLKQQLERAKQKIIKEQPKVKEAKANEKPLEQVSDQSAFKGGEQLVSKELAKDNKELPLPLPLTGAGEALPKDEQQTVKLAGEYSQEPVAATTHLEEKQAEYNDANKDQVSSAKDERLSEQLKVEAAALAGSIAGHVKKSGEEKPGKMASQIKDQDSKEQDTKEQAKAVSKQLAQHVSASGDESKKLLPPLSPKSQQGPKGGAHGMG